MKINEVRGLTVVSIVANKLNYDKTHWVAQASRGGRIDAYSSKRTH